MSDKSTFAKVLPGSDFRVICPDCTWTIRFQYDENTRFITECQGCGGKWILTMNRYKQKANEMGNEPDLVPPWASPTEKGVFCIGCKRTFPDVPSFRAHLIPEEGRCDGGKPEPKAPDLFDCYD